MTLCPVALAVGCAKCPAFSFCPLKTVIGDVPKPVDGKPAVPPKSEYRAADPGHQAGYPTVASSPVEAQEAAFRERRLVADWRQRSTAA